jgi:hypothetical protein
VIEMHEFNAAWWGAPVGITNDFTVLTSPPGALTRLDEFAWVEARVPQSSIPMGWLGPTNGFQWVDLQLSYRANLRRIDPLPADIQVVSAADDGIDVLDFAPFMAERYARLPGITDALLARRYKDWARSLVAASPNSCATVRHRGKIAGYVFGSVNGTTASFTLAVSSRTAESPGLTVYLGAAHLFRSLGATTMSSALSATNVAAINAHVTLRCLFTQATGIWLRVGSTAMTALHS